MKSATRKTLTIILGILVLLVIIAALLLPRLIDPNQHHGRIVSELEKALGGSVRVGRIDWGITNGVWIEVEDFSVAGSSAMPVDFKVPRFYANISIPPLLKKKIVLNHLRLESPEAQVRLASSRQERAVQPVSPPSGAKPRGVALPIGIEELILTGGRVQVLDSLTLPGQQLVHAFSDVAITAIDMALGQEIAFDVALRDDAPSGFGGLKAKGTFSGLTEAFTLENARLTVKATLSPLHAESVKAYLPGSPLIQRLGGSVSLVVNCESDLSSYSRWEGSVDISRMTYTDPSLWDEGLRGDKGTITYRVSLNPTRLTVEELAMKLGNLSLSASSGVENWSGRPVIKNVKFTSELSLRELIPLIPWKVMGENADILRPTLEGGGKIVIEQAAIPELSLAELPTTAKGILSVLALKARAAVWFADLEVEPSSVLPSFEDVKGRINLDNGVLTAMGVQGRMGPLSLPDLNIRISRLDGSPKVAVRAKGPLTLAATSDEKVEELLKQCGLKSLAVSADMDMRADFDEELQDGWVADASLVFAEGRAETYPEGVVADNLQGRVTVSRREAINITAEEIKGQVNQAPVRLSGKILEVGTPNLVVDVKANAKQLDLAHVRELFPALKKVNLGGTVDMDLEIYIPYATARKSRLNGMLATQNLNFQLAHLTVEKADTEFNLTGNTAFIKTAKAQVNDTLVALTGQISNPVEPNIQLLVTSPDLDLDRLLPPGTAEKSGEKPLQEEAVSAPEKRVKAGWPPVALKMTAQVRVDAKEARYMGMKYQNLKVDADYDRGAIKQWDLSLDTEGGRIAATGSVDLRDLEHVTFAVSPIIRSLMVERIAPLLGIPSGSLSGPISLSGRLQGLTGGSEDLLASLRGNLDAQIGPGKLTRMGRGGELLARMISLTSVRGILTASVLEDFASKGMPYRRISSKASFNNGNMDLTNFRFESNAMQVDAEGRINLLKEQMDVGARLKPLGKVSTVIESVPLVGKVAASMTEIRFNLSGSLDDPRVSVIPGQGIADSVQDQAKEVGSVFKGAADPVGSEENKWIRR